METFDEIRTRLRNMLAAPFTEHSDLTIDEGYHMADCTLDLLYKNMPDDEMFEQILEEELERHEDEEGWSDREAVEKAVAKRMVVLTRLNIELREAAKDVGIDPA